MLAAALANALVALWDGAPKTHLLVFLASLKIGIEAVLPMELAPLRRDLLNQIISMKHHLYVFGRISCFITLVKEPIA